MRELSSVFCGYSGLVFFSFLLLFLLLCAIFGEHKENPPNLFHHAPTNFKSSKPKLLDRPSVNGTDGFFLSRKVKLSCHLHVVELLPHRRSFASQMDGNMIIIVGGCCIEAAHIVLMYF